MVFTAIYNWYYSIDESTHSENSRPKFIITTTLLEEQRKKLKSTLNIYMLQENLREKHMKIEFLKGEKKTYVQVIKKSSSDRSSDRRAELRSTVCQNSQIKPQLYISQCDLLEQIKNLKKTELNTVKTFHERPLIKEIHEYFKIKNIVY